MKLLFELTGMGIFRVVNRFKKSLNCRKTGPNSNHSPLEIRNSQNIPGYTPDYRYIMNG